MTFIEKFKEIKEETARLGLMMQEKSVDLDKLEKGEEGDADEIITKTEEISSKLEDLGRILLEASNNSRRTQIAKEIKQKKNKEKTMTRKVYLGNILNFARNGENCRLVDRGDEIRVCSLGYTGPGEVLTEVKARDYHYFPTDEYFTQKEYFKRWLNFCFKEEGLGLEVI